MTYKNPPTAKIYEALSVIADGRIEYTGNNRAKVYSSDKSKFYTIAWSEDNLNFYSDDNASKWQGYTGYPIIAILLDQKILDAGSINTAIFSNINWNALNKQYKRDYSAAVDQVLGERLQNEMEARSTIESVKKIYADLCAMKLQKVSMKSLS